LSWPSHSFYDDQTQAAQCSNAALFPHPVSLGPTTPSGGALVTPTFTTTLNSITHTIATCINWVDASGSAFAQAYKQTNVFVTWTDSAGAHSVTQQSTVYPGGEPKYSGPQNNYTAATTTTTTPAVPPSPPTGVKATTQLAGTSTNAIDVAWVAPTGTPAADHYIVQDNSTGNFTNGQFASSPRLTATVWTLSGLTAGVTYYVRVVAIAGPLSSSPSAVASATTAVASQSCVVSGLSVTPTTVLLERNGTVVPGTVITVTVNVTNACGAGLVQVQYTTAGSPSTQLTTMTGSGAGQWTVNVGTSTTLWTVGSNPFTMFYNGVQVSPTVQQLVQFNACVSTGPPSGRTC
jgi:hypothetical protein